VHLSSKERSSTCALPTVSNYTWSWYQGHLPSEMPSGAMVQPGLLQSCVGATPARAVCASSRQGHSSLLGGVSWGAPCICQILWLVACTFGLTVAR
jgi:hypothetical protein